MTSPLVKRFLVSFERHKLIGLFGFVFVVGLSGVVAMLPPPEPTPDKFQASSLLRSQAPPPTFTKTGELLQQQGQATINRELLLHDTVVKPVLDATQIKPKTFFKNLKVQLPKEEEKGPLTIQLRYKDGDGERALFILDLLMKNMISKSS